MFAWYLQVLVYPWTPSNVTSKRPTISLDGYKYMKDEMKEDQSPYSWNILLNSIFSKFQLLCVQQRLEPEFW